MDLPDASSAFPERLALLLVVDSLLHGFQVLFPALPVVVLSFSDAQAPQNKMRERINKKE